MKKNLISAVCILLAFILTVGLVSCSNTPEETNLWATATYLNDTEFGSGASTVEVEVKAEEKSVLFTIKTDKKTLGDALVEHNLIEGNEDQYGLYVTAVNGITADYSVNNSYWAFYKNGEYMMTGVDSTEISDGEHYELIYTIMSE
ncbi:MAG: DUF4430 domain-containing protein [Clostridia bacterium]|nr:DUF4430 domain-containing protein [Clostridia bacterium]